MLDAGSLGDYERQVRPFLDAATRGDWSQFLAGPISMGPLALVARLPFVLAASAVGAGKLAQYQAGLIPCVAAAAFVSGLIARRALRRGATWPMVFVFAGVGLLNPFTIKAIENGHPEELLTAALLVGAILAAPGRSYWIAGGLLGLAIASKQWALVGVFPVALAAPHLRGRLLAWAAAIVIALNAPLVVAHPDRFYSVQRAAASASRTASFANVWWPFLQPGPREVVRDGQRIALSETRLAPTPLTRLTHPLIVILPALLALIAWLRRSLSLSNLLALLVVALLLRCVLDPIDNVYYHLPALIALLAWESERGARGHRPVPILSLAMAIAGWLTFVVLPGDLTLAQLNATYLAWSLPLLGTMLWLALRAPPDARTAGRPALPSGIPA